MNAAKTSRHKSWSVLRFLEAILRCSAPFVRDTCSRSHTASSSGSPLSFAIRSARRSTARLYFGDPACFQRWNQSFLHCHCTGKWQPLWLCSDHLSVNFPMTLLMVLTVSLTSAHGESGSAAPLLTRNARLSGWSKPRGIPIIGTLFMDLLTQIMY